MVKMIAPDGGWGWVVVFGVALTNTFNQSLLSVFGLIFGDKLEEMGQGTVGATLVGNIMLLVTNFSGIVTGPALKRFSARQVSMTGCILAGCGMIASSYATAVWHLLVSYSIFTGLGIGLIQPSSFVAVNAYFGRRRGQAVGASMAGTGVGQMLMPHLVRILLDTYGYRGTALLLGALAFNGIVGSALFQPVQWHLIPEDEASKERKPLLAKPKPGATEKRGEYVMEEKARLKENRDSKMNSETYFGDVSLTLPCDVEKMADATKNDKKKTHVDVNSNVYDKSSVTGSVAEQKPGGIWGKIKKLLDLDLLLDFTFLNIIFAVGLGFTSNQNFNMLFPFFLQQQVGMSRDQTAMCMSAMAATDILARLTVPAVTDHFRIRSRINYLVGCVGIILARVVLCFQVNYMGFLLASFMCGFFRSALVINQNLCVSEYCSNVDEKKLPAALGLNMMMKGITVISLGQLLGWIRDYTDSYVICIFSQNFLLVLIVIMWIPELLYKRYISVNSC